MVPVLLEGFEHGVFNNAGGAIFTSGQNYGSQPHIRIYRSLSYPSVSLDAEMIEYLDALAKDKNNPLYP